MSSRDACSCFRSLKSRLRDSPSSLKRVSSNGTPHTIHNHTRRSLTTVSTSESPSLDPAQSSLESMLDTKSTRKPRIKQDHYYKTSAGVVLLRSPIITRELTDFEKAFYAYQQNLKARLSSPFPVDFYFTKGSLASKRWQAGEEARRRSHDLQSNTPLTSSASAESGTPTQGEELSGGERELQDEEDIASTVAMSRTTEADAKNDTKSLNRRLDRTLYLLLKKPREEFAWQFPQGATGAKEELHDSASRVLATLAGRDMNTWAVGRVPIGHLAYKYPSPQMGFQGNKVYFMKNRIFAGQCVVQKDSGIEDFGWFTREELEERLAPEYWKRVQTMLGAR